MDKDRFLELWQITFKIFMLIFTFRLPVWDEVLTHTHTHDMTLKHKKYVNIPSNEFFPFFFTQS